MSDDKREEKSKDGDSVDSRLDATARTRVIFYCFHRNIVATFFIRSMGNRNEDATFHAFTISTPMT
jgi:hypothetical protein